MRNSKNSRADKSAVVLFVLAAMPLIAADSAKVTFTKDVAPILQKNCQECHRPGEVAPMSLRTYAESRPWAKAIRAAVLSKKMPPWFADPAYGHFVNDRSLTKTEIDTLVAWADSGAIEGDAKDLPKPVAFEDGWTIGKPDVVLESPVELTIPEKGILDIMYVVIQGNFKEDRWIQMAEVRPGNRAVVHHMTAYIRPPESQFLRNHPFGVPYTPKPVKGPIVQPASSNQSSNDKLAGYAPGQGPKSLQPGQGKFLPAGSDILLQIHYATNGKAGVDRPKVGIVFSKEAPKERVMAIVAKSWDFVIPPGAPNHEVRSSVAFATDVNLISFHPHMHYRGKDYEYRAIYPNGETQTLLRVPRYTFEWQDTYYLTNPIKLPAGTRVEGIAHFDNSPNNLRNPDPTRQVTYGEQSADEMMSGWIDVGIPPTQDPKKIVAVTKSGVQD